ncbi:MAG: proteasome accessory factor PafA2 family protein [Aggregatilineales bacterium]
MATPKLIGIETEYGILVLNALASNPFVASRLVLGQCEEAGALLRRQQVKESRLARARQAQKAVYSAPEMQDIRLLDSGEPLVEMLSAEQPVRAETYMATYGWDYSSLMLPNGSRFYIDHAHPEYCTAETRLPRTALAADKAGEIIVERARQRANASQALAAGEEIAIYKNNSDHKGNSYGCHENYLLSAALYEDLIMRRFHRTLRVLIPFLTSRAIFCGSGKVGSENNNPADGYQLTQRADFFETLIGLQTTHNRPLINTRDEPHAARDEYRRLHVILGDANMAEYGTFLKIGTTQIILSMLEDNAIALNFTFDDPIEAYQAISRDLTFSRPLLLDSGGTITALEMQRQFYAAARDYVEAKAGELADDLLAAYREVLGVWADTLDKLGRDWRLLSTRLDWAIKRNLLERYLTSQRTDWSQVALWELPIELTLDQTREMMGTSPEAVQAAIRRLHGVRGSYLESYMARYKLSYADYWRQREIYFSLRRLDLEYHDIRRGAEPRQSGIFYRLQASGAVERLLTDAEIEPYITLPPEDTRAYLRGTLLARFGEHVSHVDWSEISFREPYMTHDLYLAMPDPLSGTRAQVELLLAGVTDLQGLMRALKPVVQPYYRTYSTYESYSYGGY